MRRKRAVSKSGGSPRCGCDRFAAAQPALAASSPALPRPNTRNFHGIEPPFHALMVGHFELFCGHIWHGFLVSCCLLIPGCRDYHGGMEENPYASPLPFELHRQSLTIYERYVRKVRILRVCWLALIFSIPFLVGWFQMKMVVAGIPGPMVVEITSPIILTGALAASVLMVGIRILMAIQYRRENPDAPVFWFPRWRDPRWRENRKRIFHNPLSGRANNSP